MKKLPKKITDYFYNPKQEEISDILNNIQAVHNELNIRYRLILNVFTTPHRLISGSKNKYFKYRQLCEISIIELAFALNNNNQPSKKDILYSLIYGEDNKVGEQFLGYKFERNDVIIHLQNIINNYSI